MHDSKNALSDLVDSETPTSVTSLSKVAADHHRRLHFRVGFVATTAVLVAGGVAWGVASGDSSQAPTANPSPPAGHTAVSNGHHVSTSCVETFDEATLAGRAFAFDGTVVAVTDGHVGLGLDSVTFSVNRWYAGGSGDEASILMPPSAKSGMTLDEYGVTYAVGTRLLVSGEPRWGGAPMDNALAWTCGFTRVYSTDEAQLWDAAFDHR